MITKFDTTSGGGEKSSGGSGWVIGFLLGAAALVGLYFWNKYKKEKEAAEKQENQEGKEQV